MLLPPIFNSPASEYLAFHASKRPLDAFELMEILQVSSLEGINLSGADLSSGQFKDTSFKGANLTGVNFDSANLEGAQLAKASIGSAYFQGSNLRRANFSNAALLRREHVRETYSVSGAIFEGADLQKAKLLSAVLSGSTFENSNLKGADLRNADLTDCYVSDADLTGANLKNTIMGRLNGEKCIYDANALTPGQRWGLALLAEEAGPRSAEEILELLGLDTFAGADLRGCNFEQIDISGYDFSHANLESSRFHLVRAQQSKFIGANLKWSELEMSDFTGADFSEANLSHVGVPIRGCIVFGPSSFTDANLRGANLAHAYIHCKDPIDANFEGAKTRGLRLDTGSYVFDPFGLPTLL